MCSGRRTCRRCFSDCTGIEQNTYDLNTEKGQRIKSLALSFGFAVLPQGKRGAAKLWGPPEYAYF